VQRVTPTSATAPSAPAGPPPRTLGSSAPKTSSGALTFRSVAGLPEDQRPMTADMSRSGGGAAGRILVSTPKAFTTGKARPPSGPPPSRAGGMASAPDTPAPVTDKRKQDDRDEAEEEEDEWVKNFERKWAKSMNGEAPDDDDEDDGAEPAAKKARQAMPQTSKAGSVAAKAPPKAKAPGSKPPSAAEVVAKKAESARLVEAAKIRDEKPEWASRCNVEAARPGQPQKLAISMAEVGLGDAGVAEWCAWMDQRLMYEQPGGNNMKTKFKASNVDFSENKLGVAGVKALCALLEKHRVRCDVLRLTGNAMGNEGMRYVAKYLTCFGQPAASELHVSRNARVTGEGIKWLLGSLAMHPAYPIWSSETNRYVPLWIRAESAKVRGDAGYQVLQAACKSTFCSVCLGESSGDTKCGPRQCVNVGCCDEIKHDCVAHLCGWELPEGADPLPEPRAHPRPIFAAAGKGAPKPPPSGVEAPKRDEPRIVYEDEDLAVVLKPAGWSCLPNPKGVNPTWVKLKPLARRRQVGELMAQDAAPPLQAWLLLHYGADPNCDAVRDQGSDRGLAHRLDLEASGPVLIGKTLRGYEHARKQIAVGVLKDYLALVHGSFQVERGECTAPIDTSPYAQTKRVRIDPAGQPASTVWQALAEYESSDRTERYTLVHCRMVTLRTHQLRAHMQHLGHQLVGDKLYGDGEVPSFCPRLFLHKYRIGFFNMQGQACLEACSLQTSPDLWKALGRLRKVGGMAMMGCGAPGL